MASTKTPTPDSLLTCRQLAERLGFTHLTVYRMTREGLLPHYKVGRWIRYSLPEVLDAMKANGR